MSTIRNDHTDDSIEDATVVGSARIPFRSGRLVAVVLALCIGFLAAGCTPDAPAGSATYKVGRCVGDEGVTVVVDFAAFNGDIVVRCALGNQTSGFSVLDNAGFAHDPGKYPGTVCQLNGLPTQGHPYCWTTGGYWSYWKAGQAGNAWVYSEWGAGAGPSPAPGAVEGWRFAPFNEGTAKPPRIGTSGPIVP